MAETRWYTTGVRFGCTESGACCLNHGEYDTVYFTRREEERLAAHLGLPIREVRKKFIRIENGYRVARSRRGACVFLDGHRCSIYRYRPVPCRTWPFWPDTMKKRAWESEVVPMCRGVGRGRRFSRAEIEAAMKRKARHDRELEEDD